MLATMTKGDEWTWMFVVMCDEKGCKDSERVV